MLVIRGRRVVFPDGEQPASIHVEGGTIARVAADDDVPRAEVVDAGDFIVAPGLVDTHVHVNEPGRTEWEGFDTATRAAAAGGVTTIVDMPLNSVPATVTRAALEEKREAARGKCHVDVAFWGGLVPGNDSQIEGLIHDGVRGFKCFLAPSGVDEFASVTEEDLRRALPVVARAARGRACPVLVHAEDPTRFGGPSGDRRCYATYLATRPVDAEVAAIELISRLAHEYHVTTHIVHVSSAEGIEAIARAQASGTRMTAETCPHYLTFAAEDVKESATAFKCAPPIRERGHRDALWHGLAQRQCTIVASDHSPAPAALKCAETGDFIAAWGGVASLELSLAATWSGAGDRGFGISDVMRWMSESPAQLCGLGGRKGRISPGADADLIVWDPDARSTVDAERMQQRHKVTPYAGLSLRGVVRATYVRGVRVWEEGELLGPGTGRLL